MTLRRFAAVLLARGNILLLILEKENKRNLTFMYQCIMIQFLQNDQQDATL
jgi:hypothetical protein